MTDRILITNCTLPSSTTETPTPLCYITTDDGLISAIGPMEQCPAAIDRLVIDGGGKLVIPGLINGHNHCAMTLFRGLADDLDLSRWLHEHIFPAEAAHVNPEMVYWCTKLAAAEMLLSGTTSVADGYFFSNYAAQALHDAGLRAVVAHGIVDFPAPSVPDPKKNIETVELFLSRWQDRSPRITPAVFAHAPYTCSPRTLQRAKALADDHRVRFFIHIAESRLEQHTIIEPQGPTPISHLANLGILDEMSVCVHCVWLSDEDLDILAESSASVITCPQSNLKLASGIARVQDMLDLGITVGLGTDSCASNNSLDMFREMDMLAKIQKSATQEATAMNGADVLACATTAGARAIGLSEIGAVTAGLKADLVLLDTGRPHLNPFYNEDLLVYAASGSDVHSVIIDGTLVVHEGAVISFDPAEAYEEVRKRAQTLGALDLW